MILPGSYANGFAPRDGQPLYPELWRNCVGAWAPCLGPTGLTLRDWSGFGSHGVLTDMEVGQDWTIASGKYNLNLGGDGDYVKLANANVGPLYSVGTGDFAVAMHASFVSGTYRAMIGNQTGFTNGMLWGRNTTNLGGYLGSSSEMNSGVVIPADGTWHHYGIQRSGTTISFWMDGKVAPNTFTRSQSMSSAVITTLGTAAGYGTWPGGVDDVRMYSRPLYSSEWLALASRRGIAYELAPRRRSSVAVAAAFNRRRRLLVGAGS